MKIQVRQSVFETNSSSTHALAVYKKEEWGEFKHHNGFMEMYLSDVITEEELKEQYEKDPNKENYKDFDDWYENTGLYSYDEMNNRYDILEEEVPGTDYVAVSIEGWD